MCKKSSSFVLCVCYLNEFAVIQFKEFRNLPFLLPNFPHLVLFVTLCVIWTAAPYVSVSSLLHYLINAHNKSGQAQIIHLVVLMGYITGQSGHPHSQRPNVLCVCLLMLNIQQSVTALVHTVPTHNSKIGDDLCCVRTTRREAVALRVCFTENIIYMLRSDRTAVFWFSCSTAREEVVLFCCRHS